MSKKNISKALREGALNVLLNTPPKTTQLVFTTDLSKCGRAIRRAAEKQSRREKK